MTRALLLAGVGLFTGWTLGVFAGYRAGCDDQARADEARVNDAEGARADADAACAYLRRQIGKRSA